MPSWPSLHFGEGAGGDGDLEQMCLCHGMCLELRGQVGELVLPRCISEMDREASAASTLTSAELLHWPQPSCLVTERGLHGKQMVSVCFVFLINCMCGDVML